jgi:hypothetical protein
VAGGWVVDMTVMTVDIIAIVASGILLMAFLLVRAWWGEIQEKFLDTNPQSLRDCPNALLSTRRLVTPRLSKSKSFSWTPVQKRWRFLGFWGWIITGCRNPRKILGCILPCMGGEYHAVTVS